MYWPKHLVIRRMIPGGKCAGTIIFKGTPKPKLCKRVDINDPYYDPSFVGEAPSEETEIALFATGETIGFKLYKPNLDLNIIEDITLWVTYSIREFKIILSAFIGCPVSHIDIRASVDGKSLGHIYSEEGISVIDPLRRVSALPSQVELYLWGDFRDSSNMTMRWPEIESDLETVGPISGQPRTRIMRDFIARDRIMIDLSKVDIIKGIKGSIISTGFASPPESDAHGLDIRRVYEIFHITPSDETVKSPITINGVYYNNGENIICRVDERTIKPVSVAIPKYPNSMTVLITLHSPVLPARLKSVAPRSFIMTLRDDCWLNAFTNWGDIKQIDNEDAKIVSRIAMQYIVNTITRMHKEDYSLADSRIIFETDDIIVSNMQYYEMFEGGNYRQLQDLLGNLSRLSLVKQTFTGETKLSFYLPAFDTYDRKYVLSNFIRERIPHLNAAVIWNKADVAVEVMSRVLEGPFLTVNYDDRSNSLRVEIKDTTNETEMSFAREAARRIVGSIGYKASRKEEAIAPGYLSLALLEHTDHELFGTRVLESGERVNFSRKCQTPERHPKPISAGEAEKLPKDRVIKLRNFTYGGEQIYYCPSSKFPYPALRQVAVDELCVLCCNATKIVPDSLKAREFYTCAIKLMYDEKDLDEFAKSIKMLPYTAPIQFTGQDIPEGRLCKLPDGVREILPPDVYMYFPPGIDRKNIGEIVNWLKDLELDIESELLHQQLVELLSNSISLAIIDLKSAGGKRWYPELVIPVYSGYMVHDGSILVFKLGDSYYPAMNSKIEPAETPSNIITTFEEYRKRKEGYALQVFTLDRLKSLTTQVKFQILAHIVYEFKTYAILLEYNGQRFAIPIVPCDCPSEREIAQEELTKYLPDIEILTKFLVALHNVAEAPEFIVERAVIGPNKAIYGFELRGEPVLFYTKSFKAYPRIYELSEAYVTSVIDPRLFKFLLSGPSSAATKIDPLLRIERTIHIAQMYLANVAIRRAKLKLDPSDKDASIEIMKKSLRKYVKLSKDISLPLEGDNIVMFSRELSITKEIYDIAIARLIEQAPKSAGLFKLYIVTRGSLVDPNKYDMRTGEKILTIPVP